MLTMHVLAHCFDGPNIHHHRKAFLFEVDGLPERQQAQIRESYHRWQFRSAIDRVWCEWSGQHGSAEEALAELSASLRHLSILRSEK